MAIKINLLAEQQAAEEARRKDPVKRGIYVGIFLVLLMLLWGFSIHMDVRAARKRLRDQEQKLASLDDPSKRALQEKALDVELSRKLNSLENYSTNRFYWGSMLDALQRVTVDNVKAVDFSAVQNYYLLPQIKVTTNISMAVTPPSRWGFLGSDAPQTNVLIAFTNQLATVTNRPTFHTNKAPYTIKMDVSTNATKTLATAKIEIVIPVSAIEATVFTLRAKDYGVPPGNLVQKYTEMLAGLPYFKTNLNKMEGQGVRLKDRPVRPQTDPSDPINPLQEFIPFTLECRFEEKQLANE